MKQLILILSVVASLNIQAQETKTLYNPQANAAADVATAVKKAKAEGKFVIIQAGGNWCKWCKEFARFSTADATIDSTLKASFILYHLNYSKENENKAMFAKLDYPQRFGYPSFIILNQKGQRIHTQNSEYLEDGKGSYDKQKVQEFLFNWTPKAVSGVSKK